MEQNREEQLQKLLRSVAAGDAHAFRRLYDATSSQLYAVALKMLHRRTAADDALQDAFVQIWHRAGDYHAERGSVSTWMSSIVRYRAIDSLRRDRNDDSYDESEVNLTCTELQRLDPGESDTGGTVGAGPMRNAIADDDSRFLKRCLARLSGAQLQCVTLAFFQGLTHAELADRQSLPLGTIKSRLRRSLKRLKECLAELGFTNEIFTGTD